MNILGIDLSIRTTGLAMLCTQDENSGFPEYELPGTQSLTCQWKEFRYYGALAERRSKRWVEQVEDILLPILVWAQYAHQVIIEEYSHGSQSSSMDKVHELGGIIKYSLGKIDQTPVEISPKSVKKFIAGNGNADKFKMLAAVQAGGVPILDHNMADAFGLARVGHALQLPDVAYRDWHHTEREALHAIKYPVVKVRKFKEKEKTVCESRKLPGLLL